MIATLIDIFLHNGYVLWLKDDEGENIFLKDSFQPELFIADSDLSWVRHVLWKRGVPARFAIRQTIEREKKHVLGIRADPGMMRSLVRDLEQAFPKAKLYNADLHAEQYYLFGKGLHPFCAVRYAADGNELQRIEALGEAKPILNQLSLAIATSHSLRKDFECCLTRLAINDEQHRGDEPELLLALQRALERKDPDIILLEDSNIALPYLAHRARLHGISLAFGRFPQDIAFQEDKSWFSYGRVLYRPCGVLLKGRLNIDPGGFLYAESGLAGITELASICRMGVQRLAMRSPGAGLSSLQAATAYKYGILVPYRENLVEKFKTALTLLQADRGGLIYEPQPGVYGETGEVDFVSMYPSIMVVNNISAETVLCECCRDNVVVPELGYNICRERGLIPKMLGDVLLRRAAYKKEGTPEALAKAKALKWLLVTSFGYMGFRKSKFGRIEAHEAINAFARDKLLIALKRSEKAGYKVLHGIIDSLWVQKQGISTEGLQDLCEDISKHAGVDIAVEGIYHWVVFLPSIQDGRVPVPSRFYGCFRDGSLKLRGIALRRSDSPGIVKAMQQDIIGRLSGCSCPEEFITALPSALKALKDHERRLSSAQPEQLLISRRISKLDYSQDGPQKQVVAELQRQGMRLHPGNVISYVITKGGYRSEGGQGQGGQVDILAYRKLLLRAAYELVQPFMAEERVRDFMEERQARLEDWI
ncbi:MAG: DNA polymerase domain-containing protein [Nanoarchaeota archaeon]